MKTTQVWQILGGKLWLWISTCCIKLAWTPSRVHIHSWGVWTRRDKWREGSWWGQHRHHNLSYEYGWGREFWRNVSMYLQILEVESIVAYLNLDLLFFKRVGSCSTGLAIPWWQGTVLTSMLFSWPSVMVARWHCSRLHVIMWQHPSKEEMGRKKWLCP